MTAKSTLCWYRDGLSFSCRGCGRCCRGPGGYVWLTEPEVRTLAAALAMTVDAFGKQYLRRVGTRLALIDGPRGDCVLLDGDGRCRVYEARPMQCRTYPWWPEVVASEASWEREKRHCPGIGEGRVHGFDVIQAALQASDEEE